MRSIIHTMFLIGGLWVISFQAIWGQTGDLRSAEKEYKMLNYQRAIVYYNAAPDKGLKDYRNLARCYLTIGNIEKAKQCLEKICKSEQRKPGDIWNYAQVLMQDSAYDAALDMLKEFYVANPRDGRAIRYRNAGDFRTHLLRNQNNYTLTYLPFNSTADDFGPGKLGNKLVFASTRNPYNPVVRKWNGNGQNFLNLYQVNPKLSIDPAPFEKAFQGKLHEGPIGFSGDGLHCVLTRSQQVTSSKHEKHNLGLYLADHTNSEWSALTPFPFNDPNFSVCHGALNVDGTQLYFASNRPGGKGRMDLWISKKQNGEWQKPRPLYELNTEGDELFPYILESGIILFSSNGHVGLGGLDIFAAKRQGEKFEKTMNLGFPLNSSSDDFGMILNQGMSEGYFSSNRHAPLKERSKSTSRDTLFPLMDDDIYQVKLKKPLEFGKSIYGWAIDDIGRPISGVEVVLSSARGKVLQSYQTSSKGKYEFFVYELGTYQVSGSKIQYFRDQTTATITSRNEDVETALQLKRDPSISIRLVIIESETGLPLEDVEVTILNNLENTQEFLTTTSTGDYYRRLPEKRMNDSLSYRFVLKKQDYLIKTIDFNTRITHTGAYEVHKFRVNKRYLDFSMKKKTVGDDLAQQLGILPYFYSEDKTTLEPEFTQDLDVIVQSLKDNPTLHIQIRNHTDCKGVASTNMRLSEARARAIADYISFQLPSAADRLSIRGLGESKLKSECSCEGPQGGNCTEDDYQVDRRTEFIITKI